MTKTIAASGKPHRAIYMPGSGTKTASPMRKNDTRIIETNQIVPLLVKRGVDKWYSSGFSSFSFLNQLLYITLL